MKTKAIIFLILLSSLISIPYLMGLWDVLGFRWDNEVYFNGSMFIHLWTAGLMNTMILGLLLAIVIVSTNEIYKEFVKHNEADDS